MMWSIDDSTRRYNVAKWNILGTSSVGYIAVAVAYKSTVGEADNDAGAPFAQSCWIGARCLSLAIDSYGILVWSSTRNKLLQSDRSVS